MVIPWVTFWDESCGLSNCDSVFWTGVLVVTDVLVAAMCESAFSDSDWELVEPQSFLSPKSVRLFVWRIKKNLSYEGTPVKAPPTLTEGR